MSNEIDKMLQESRLKVDKAVDLLKDYNFSDILETIAILLQDREINEIEIIGDLVVEIINERI